MCVRVCLAGVCDSMLTVNDVCTSRKKVGGCECNHEHTRTYTVEAAQCLVLSVLKSKATPIKEIKIPEKRLTRLLQS